MTLFKKVPFLRKTIRDKSLWDHFINRMGNLIEATFYHVFVVAKVNRVRRRYGLKGKFSFSIEQGDLTLLTDIPDFNPTHPLPENIKYIGPLSWHNSLPAPACLDRLDKSKKTVYVTIGSLGSEELVAEIQNLKIEDIQFVLSTGGAAPPPPPSAKNVFTESFVNAEKLLPHCHGILCHGGNGTIYQALAHGLPVVGISIHDEQYYGLKAVNDLGLGKGFSAKEFKTIGLKEVLKELASVLDDQDVHERVLAMQSKIKKYHAAKTAADLIENYSPAPTALASFNH